MVENGHYDQFCSTRDNDCKSSHVHFPVHFPVESLLHCLQMQFWPLRDRVDAVAQRREMRSYHMALRLRLEEQVWLDILPTRWKPSPTTPFGKEVIQLQRRNQLARRNCAWKPSNVTGVPENDGVKMLSLVGMAFSTWIQCTFWRILRLSFLFHPVWADHWAFVNTITLHLPASIAEKQITTWGQTKKKNQEPTLRCIASKSIQLSIKKKKERKMRSVSRNRDSAKVTYTPIYPVSDFLWAKGGGLVRSTGLACNSKHFPWVINMPVNGGCGGMGTDPRRMSSL